MGNEPKEPGGAGPDKPLAASLELAGMSRDERRADTIKSIKRQKTQLHRWVIDERLSTNPLWDDRSVAAARLIPDGVRVADLGCGDMKLERYLPAGCSYVPVDVFARDARTVVVDLNQKTLPRLDADFIVGMGVLEYIFDVPRLLRQIARQFDRGLFSYHPLEQTPSRDRLAVGWVNALNSLELLALFRAAGFKSIAVEEYKHGLHFYRVARGASAG